MTGWLNFSWIQSQENEMLPDDIGYRMNFKLWIWQIRMENPCREFSQNS